jgi:hypothetical protein
VARQGNRAEFAAGEIDQNRPVAPVQPGESRFLVVLELLNPNAHGPLAGHGLVILGPAAVSRWAALPLTKHDSIGARLARLPAEGKVPSIWNLDGGIFILPQPFFSIKETSHAKSPNRWLSSILQAILDSSRGKNVASRKPLLILSSGD